MLHRNIELLIMMSACLGVTLIVCKTFGTDELVKSGLMIAIAGGPIAVYRLWQGKSEK